MKNETGLKIAFLCFLTSLFASSNSFAISIFQQGWSNLNDEAYIESLVDCKLTIKELQWSYNIWPKENKTEKPQFAAVVNKDDIYQSVINSLKKQTVLADEFGIELTADMLQGELDRMARNSKDPKRLEELYLILGNNPTSIAECVARPNLVNRLLRNQFNNSQTIHQQAKLQAEFELKQYQRTGSLGYSNAEAYTIDYILADMANTDATDQHAYNPTEIELDQQGFTEKLDNLTALESTPFQLQEFDSGFVFEEIVDESTSSIKVKILVWQKDSLNNWLETQNTVMKSSPVSNLKVTILKTSVSSTQAVSQAGPPNTWKDFGSSAPIVRTAHSAIWTGNEMIVWGGTSPSTISNTGARYNPTTGTWTTTSLVNAPDRRLSHSAVWSGTEMIIWGGFAGNGTSTVYNSGGKYNPLTDNWVATSLTNAPVARRSHSTVWTGTEMIVWGGNADTEQIAYLNTGGIYDPLADSWTATSLTDAPLERWLHTAVWTGSEMIVWGGGIGLSTFYDSGAHYNPQTNSWTPIGTDNLPQARINHSAVWAETANKMVMWGGSAGASGNLVTGSRYDPDSRVWTDTSLSGVPLPRIVWSTVWTGEEMIIWGGFSPQVREDYNTGARYNPVNDTWTYTTLTNAPSARVSHSAVWAGSEMIVWGGATGTTKLNSGGRYDPVTDKWKATPTIKIETLTSRILHSAVWSGSEVIIWGGFDGVNGYVDSGARYDPVTDFWTQMTSDGAPVARAKHSANWTGTEMLIWGGSDGNKLDSGGRYDPEANAWLPLPSTNAPSARDAHSATWTGTEMLVWGGNDGSPVNTGASYDPALNSWTPITTTNAPTARELHTAVWTETEMIVWGGDDSNTGGRYDPDADTWTPTGTLNAPIARNSHSAVWTGTKMIIWGGRDINGYLDSGGRYDPDSGLWEETNVPNAPNARAHHSAVWSGSEMIIWGGNSGSITNTGGRYNPDTDSWLQTTSSNVPNARLQHVTVWTGTQMVIWGGGDGVSSSIRIQAESFRASSSRPTFC